MTRRVWNAGLSARALLGALALLLIASEASAIYGHWRRCARRTTAVVVGTSAAAASSAEASQQAASQQQAAAQQQQAAEDSAKSAQEAAAAAQQAATAANQAAAAAKPAPAATADKTPQQKLEELQSLYKQGLISESDYNAAKQKILAEISQ